MITMPRKLSLISLALAASMQLAACGGGSAGAPDIFPPTVVITADAVGTVTGPVTFTFTFNEDVGSSFTADDILVTGGTAGPLTRMSATVYQLVVTPPESAAGTVQVTVASDSFNDAVGNSNAVNPTVAVVFNTGVVGTSGNTGTCTAPCIDFTAAPPALDYEGFGGTLGTWETDPVDGTNKVAKLDKASGAETWAGVTIFTNVADKSVTPADFSSSKIVTLRVYSPAAGKTVRIKFEDAADNTHTVETDATTTVAGAWETLTFDFASQAPGTAAYNAAYTYNKVSVFVDFGVSPTAAETFYIDELKYPSASGGGTGGGTVGGTVLLSFDEATSPFTSAPGVFGDAAIDIAAGPSGGSGNALKLSRSGAQNFGGTYFGIAPVPFTAERKVVTARVNATRAGAVVYLKVEGPSGFVELPATVGAANSWQTLSWDLSAVDPSNSYPTMVFSADTNVADLGAQTYWIDDVTLAAASNGGGGESISCGTTEPTCAPTTVIPAGAIAIYSDAVNVASLDMAPDWGQGTAVTRSEVTIASNKSQKYVFTGAPFLYQGIDWSGSPQNVSTKGKLHLDVWSADVTSLKVSLIGGGQENGVTKTLTAGGWNGIDIDLSEFTSPDLTQVIQIKLEPSTGGTIYVDNINFHGAASSGGGGSTAFTGGIFAADYQGNLGANTAQSTLGGSVGFFLDPRLFANKAFDDGSVCGSACNPGGVYNFYYGIGKLLPALTDAYFGAFVNAPGNGVADASGFAKIKLKFWGDAESWEKPNFTAQVDVIVQGPTNAACTNPSGRPEIIKAVTAQKIGAGSEYVIPKTDFTLSENCGGAYTVDNVWSAVGSVVVRLSGTNLQYLNTVPSDPVSYPTFINMGPVTFIN